MKLGNVPYEKQLLRNHVSVQDRLGIACLKGTPERNSDISHAVYSFGCIPFFKTWH